MSAHAAAWTASRKLVDRVVSRTYPGKHHPLWPAKQPELTSALITNPAAFNALARKRAQVNA